MRERKWELEKGRQHGFIALKGWGVRKMTNCKWFTKARLSLWESNGKIALGAWHTPCSTLSIFLSLRGKKGNNKIVNMTSLFLANVWKCNSAVSLKQSYPQRIIDGLVWNVADLTRGRKRRWKYIIKDGRHMTACDLATPLLLFYLCSSKCTIRYFWKTIIIRHLWYRYKCLIVFSTDSVAPFENQRNYKNKQNRASKEWTNKHNLWGVMYCDSCYLYNI